MPASGDLRRAESIPRLFAAGDYLSAFVAADRLHRLAPNDAHALALRGRALHNLGRNALAARDVVHAFELAADDPRVAEAVLNFGPQRMHKLAALTIIRSPRSSLSGRAAAATFFLEGGEDIIVAGHTTAARAEGWAVCAAGRTLTVAESADAIRVTREVSVDALRFLFFDSRSSQPPTFRIDGLRPSRSHLEWQSADLADAPPDLAGEIKHASVHVILPIYADVAATRACLGSLALAAEAAGGVHVILVNDHPGDRTIEQLCRQAAATHGFTLIENANNMGFARSVNRALLRVGRGDLLLLNADTLLGKTALLRLRTRSRLSPSIGTLTPLSNNGEFTSLPKPFTVNPLLPLAEIERLDLIIARHAGGRSLPLPNGTGFCLYITEACRQAVGPLPLHYGRGYHEDTEFCLRAAAAGFRNLCATDVYVGHAGSRSFRTDKAALVQRNTRLLKERFPLHEEETDAFLDADLFSELRMAIALRYRPRPTALRLIVSEDRQDASTSREIARLRRQGVSVLVLSRSGARSPSEMVLAMEGEGFPQALRLDVVNLRAASQLVGYLRELRVEEIAILADCILPNSLLRLFLISDVPITLLVGRAPVNPLRPLSAGGETQPGGVGNGRSFGIEPTFLALQGEAKTIKALNALASRFLQKMGCTHLYRGIEVPGDVLEAATVRAASERRRPARKALPDPAGGRGTIAVYYPKRSATGERLLRALARAKPRIAAKRRLLVLGQSADDAALMSFPDVHVTGPVRPAEAFWLCDLHGVDAVVSGDVKADPTHVEALSRRLGAALVYYDWSLSLKSEGNGTNMYLDPRLPEDVAAAQIVTWVH